MLRDPPHYLPRLKTTTVPRRLLFLDCQADTQPEQGFLVERWQAGALGRTWWTSKKGERRDEQQVHTSPLALWEDADGFCKPGKRVVLWSHDLAWQLRVSQALVHLPKLGWQLDRIVLERTAAWALLRDGKRTLMMCDLKSWTPTELRRLSSDVDWSESIIPPLDRCKHDGPMISVYNIEAVRLAVLDILDWIVAEQLGPFRPTGSGQSYAGFRRRFLSHKLLVHDDLGRLDAERTAMWTGRCEAWQHGTLTSGPYLEYDMTAAYCRIAAEAEVPAIAGAVTTNPKTATVLKAMGRGAVLAECRVTTEQPVVPTRYGGRTVWPAGTFDTVLWDPELTLAYDYARDVKVTRMWEYRTAPALQDFAGWVLNGLDTADGSVSPIARRVLKHWSRCLVGRLGLRYRAWEKFGTLPEPELALLTFIDVEDNSITDLLHAGHDRLILAGLTEALDSLPQIPGWVMSECRRRLWQAMASCGIGRVMYVDTDSMILAPPNGTPLPPGPSSLDGPGWALKGSYGSMTVHGPRNLVCHTTRRVSGLPLSARQVAPLEFTGQVMRSIKESMRTGELDHVASIPRRFVLDAPDLRRQHHPNGQTSPYTLEVSRNAPCTDL